MTLPQISKDSLEYFRTAPSSILNDAMTRCGLGNWVEEVHPLKDEWHVAGRVRTILYGPKTGDNLTKHSIYSFADTIDDGDVILLAAGGHRGWLMGENIANYCINSGAAGVIADGFVRDKGELLEMSLPVFARGTSARPSGRDIGIVAVDVPVATTCGYVFPGDLIVADMDGVVVAPNTWVDRLKLEAQDMARLEKEQEIAIRNRQPLSAINEINSRKKIRVTA